jgi:DNA-binding SARP family transcriptional activator/tetratricopeptide (TPR) repeat protein
VKSLKISLLGAPRVEVDGLQLGVDTRKAVAMLAFLAVTGHTHSRAVIADLLWPELDGERAGGALRRTLSTLRAGLGADRLLSDRNSIALELDGAWFDLAESRAVAADPSAGIDDLRLASELHRDDLMAGFALRDSVHFDDWVRDTQDEVRRERAGLLDRLVDALAGRGRADDAVARARERLALDELHEPTHRRLIELYALAGRRGDALGQYRDCVRVLDRELGVAPLNETTELYSSISTGTPPVPLVIEEDAPPTGELAMMGRDSELNRILDAFGRVGDQGVLAVIDGESGVGKTRLAQEALVRLAHDGARVIVARPHAGEQGLAYGVIATVLRAAIDDGADDVPETLRGDAARLLPDFGAPPPTSLDEPGARLRFLEAISRLIAGAFAAAAGVVFIDDLQWCDPASLDALAYLGRRLDHRQLLLLCARRSDEPDPERRYAQLAELGERITLARLTREDVVALATRSGLAAGTAERVFRESEGLPLFVTELMSADGAAAATTTGGVRAMLDARVEAASDISAQVLSAAAIIGRTFDADDVRVVSGRSEEEVASALEELIARALIAELEQSYDFSNERLRGVVEDRLGRARRRLLHGRAAHALMTRHEDHAIIARHLELAGDEKEAATEYAAAGDRARALSARAEAVAHYEAALALGYPDPAALRESIGDVHTLRGEYDLALAAYNAAAAQTERDGAGRLEHKLGAVHERRGDWQLAEIHYRQGLTFGADRAVVQSDRSRVAWRRGDAEQARTLGFEALGLAQDSGAQAAEAQANNILGLLGGGREYLQRSLELSDGLADASVKIAALNNLALDHAAAGELAEAEALTREALELCIARGDRHHEAALRNNLADVLHQAGRQDGAMEELKRAVTAFAAIGSESESLYPGVWGLVEW